MLSVIQIATKASVKIKDREETLRSIDKGLVVYLGVSSQDVEQDVDKTVNKILKLRVFPDDQQKMNLSILGVQGEIILVSQFTLFGDLKGNNRPNFTQAANKELALKLFEKVANEIKLQGISVTVGYFGEHMEIEQTNDGPVTIIVDTKTL